MKICAIYSTPFSGREKSAWCIILLFVLLSTRTVCHKAHRSAHPELLPCSGCKHSGKRQPRTWAGWHTAASPPHLPAFHILFFVQNFEARQISTNLVLFTWSWSTELLGGYVARSHPMDIIIQAAWLCTPQVPLVEYRAIKNKETNTPRHRWSVLDNTWAYLFYPNISCKAFNNAAGFLINTTLLIITEICASIQKRCCIGITTVALKTLFLVRETATTIFLIHINCTQ